MSISDLHHTDTSDIALIERTRDGDLQAYGVLHERHAGAARALARRMSRSDADADDLVSEGFARVLGALQRGKGPDVAFRPYLLSTVRRLAYDRTTRERREAPSETSDDTVGEATSTDPVLDGFERDTAAAAFASLPERWRMVLWHTEVEGQSPAEVGVLLGMNPNAVAALAYRAREGLRQAYLTEHTPRAASGKECERTMARLGAFVRGGLTATRAAKVQRHLDDCDDCTSAYLELANVNTAMPALIGVAVLGPAGAAYAATAGGSAAASAAFTAAITPLVQGATSLTGAGAGAVGGLAAAKAVARVATKSKYAVGASAAASVIAVVAVVAALQGGAPEEPAAASADAPARPDTITSSAEVEGASTTKARSSGTEPTATTSTTVAPSTTATPDGSPVPVVPEEPVRPRPDVVPPTPPVPSELAVEVRSAGLLVAGRPGVIVASLRNDGPGPGSEPTVRIELTGATVRGEQLTDLTEGAGSGWTCTSVSPTIAECRRPPLEPEASASVYVPVSVPGGDGVTVRATVLADHDRGQHDGGLDVHLPVARTGMAARFATVDRGGIATVGNTLLTCPPSASGCDVALRGGPGAGDNGAFNMVPVDVDGDPATSSSSAAEVDLGGSRDVLSATLYWSAGLDAGEGGRPAAEPSRRGRVVVRAPGGAKVEVVAERVDDVNGRYQAVADVTALVRAGGPGRWTVGGIQLATGTNTHAGWSLVVAYRKPTLPLRSLVVLDGFASVDGSAPVHFEVGGFAVPTGGSGRATLDVVAYEGDASLAGDQLVVDDVALTDAANPLGNSFNSSSSDQGRPRGGDPSWANLLGIDIDRFDVTSALAPGSTSATISFTTTSDRYYTGAVAFSIDQ